MFTGDNDVRWRLLEGSGIVFCLFLACEGPPEKVRYPNSTDADLPADNTDDTVCLEENDCDLDGVPTPKDCDDYDPDKILWVLPDRDGDGYPENTGWYCVGIPIPEGYAERSDKSDCDDSDPEAWQYICMDGDGDGYYRTGTLICGGATMPPGYAVCKGKEDCDDDDNEVHRFGYEDLDGDLDVGRESTVCVSGEYTGEYAFDPGGDCDDGDPAIASYRPDIFGDGIDGNCDGQDGYAPCESDRECSCYDVARTERWIYETTCREGIDIAIVDRVPCATDCGERSAYIVLANLGGIPYEGTVQIDYDSLEGFNSTDSGNLSTVEPSHLSTRFSITMDPSEIRAMVVSPLASTVALTALSGEDCDPLNNTASIPSPILGFCP